MIELCDISASNLYFYSLLILLVVLMISCFLRHLIIFVCTELQSLIRSFKINQVQASRFFFFFMVHRLGQSAMK